MKFTKMHGAGNDYIYIDASDQKNDWSELAVAMSDRHTGIGADGLILALESKTSDIQMKMFNSDGSEGEMCGNGIRCLVGFAFEHGILSDHTSPVKVETRGGEREVIPTWKDGKVIGATVGMGEPNFEVASIPVIAPGYEMLMNYPLEVDGYKFNINCVSMGNPHAVVFMDTPIDKIPLNQIGPIVERHPMFPQRTNFEIANVIDSSHIDLRVWERGSGITMACGTGASATAAIGRLQRLTGSEVDVSLPGGTLVVKWDGPGSGDLILEGPVQTVYEGEWP